MKLLLSLTLAMSLGLAGTAAGGGTARGFIGAPPSSTPTPSPTPPPTATPVPSPPSGTQLVNDMLRIMRRAGSAHSEVRFTLQEPHLARQQERIRLDVSWRAHRISGRGQVTRTDLSHHPARSSTAQGRLIYVGDTQASFTRGQSWSCSRAAGNFRSRSRPICVTNWRRAESSS